MNHLCGTTVGCQWLTGQTRADKLPASVISRGQPIDSSKGGNALLCRHSYS